MVPLEPWQLLPHSFFLFGGHTQHAQGTLLALCSGDHTWLQGFEFRSVGIKASAFTPPLSLHTSTPLVSFSLGEHLAVLKNQTVPGLGAVLPTWKTCTPSRGLA